jgi:serine/threonine-protein kinase
MTDPKPPPRELFEAAVALPMAERAGYLDRHCPDAQQRAIVERMLEADADAAARVLDDSFDALLGRVGDSANDAEAMSPIGSAVGPFTLQQKLGEGGSSIVFRATREHSGVIQTVALKLLRRGLYSKDEQRRFRSERLALAQLRHPGIARLIEGGVTDSGVPYIALELIDGEPITDYAREQRLDLRHRLQLFVAVCRAVEAAHRALIVHRDLKPSNVLVTHDGEVKLLDFGIAKLLDADAGADATHTQHQAMTPAYAAPEQFSRGAITTATDVYALGVLLAELITGTRREPGDSRTPSSQISEHTEPGVLPAPPKVTRRQLRGDLDNVVLKATASASEQRYASAGAFADDLERHLAGQPVAAHPPSRWYRTRKFVTRHKGGVMTTAAFLLAIVAALGLALWQARIARQEAARANVVRDFLVSVFQSAGADLPKDKRPSSQDLVDQAAKRLMQQSELADATRAELLLTLAKVSISVGEYDHALALLDRATPIVDALYGEADARWLDARVTRAAVLEGKSDYAGLISLLDPLRARLLAHRDEIGFLGLGMLGNALVHSGTDRTDPGLDLLRQAREAAEAESARLPNAALPAMIREASTLFDARRFREGLDRAEIAIALWRRQGAQINPRIADLYGAIALGAEAAGDIPRAEAAYKEAIALDERFFDKPNPHTAWDVGIYGTFLVSQGRSSEAEPYVRRGLELRKIVYGESDPRTLYGVAGMGKLYTSRNDFAEADKWYGQGIDICRSTALHDNVCPQLLSMRGYDLSYEGRLDEAAQDLREAMDLQGKMSGASSPAFASILKMLVTVQTKQHNYDQAIASADRVLAINKTVKGGMVQVDLDTRYWRARALSGLGRNDEALGEILDVEPKFASLFPKGNSRFGMLRLKAQTLAAANRFDEAAKAAQEALALPRKPTFSPEPGTLEELERLADPHRSK